MSNIIQVRFPQGEVKELEYSNFGSFIGFAGENNLSNPKSERNKHSFIIVPEGLPKATAKEIATLGEQYGMGIETSDELDWISRKSGSLDSEKAMKEKGFTGTLEEWKSAISQIKKLIDDLDSKMEIGKCSFAIPLRKTEESK